MKARSGRVLLVCAVMIFLLYAVLSGGTAEAGWPVFEGVWSDDGVHAVIQRDCDIYHVRISWGDGEFSTISEYECRYDAQQRCLTGNGTTVYEETGETAEDKDVTLTINDEGVLAISNPRWEEGVGPIEAFYTGMYEGIWKNGNQTIRMDAFGGYMYCFVEEQGTGIRTEWEYTCEYDEATGDLICPYDFTGRKTVIRGSGEEESKSEASDAGKAVFSIDNDGYLTWKEPKENAGEGRRYERQALYESRFTYTLRYPEKTVDVRFIEPYTYLDSGFDQFSVKEAGNQVHMSCNLYTDTAYPFWEEELNYRKLKTDDTWLDQIETSMEKSLGLYLSPD